MLKHRVCREWNCLPFCKQAFLSRLASSYIYKAMSSSLPVTYLSEWPRVFGYNRLLITKTRFMLGRRCLLWFLLWIRISMPLLYLHHHTLGRVVVVLTSGLFYTPNETPTWKISICQFGIGTWHFSFLENYEARKTKHHACFSLPFLQTVRINSSLCP